MVTVEDELDEIETTFLSSEDPVVSLGGLQKGRIFLFAQC